MFLMFKAIILLMILNTMISLFNLFALVIPIVADMKNSCRRSIRIILLLTIYNLDSSNKHFVLTFLDNHCQACYHLKYIKNYERSKLKIVNKSLKNQNGQN